MQPYGRRRVEEHAMSRGSEMETQSKTPAPPRRFLYTAGAVYHSLWVQIPLLFFCFFAILHAIGHPQDFKSLREVSAEVAESFNGLTPEAFTEALKDRNEHCQYRWLFFCSERASVKR